MALPRSAPILILATALVLAGCATIEHTYTAGEYADRLLPVASAEGSKRLDMEVERDATVRDYLIDNGRPEYLYVLDRKTLYLFYVGRDRVAVVHRDLLRAGELQEMERIPGSLLKLLPQRDIARIQAAREKRRAQKAKSRPRRTTRKRGAAASPSPEGFSLRHFDVNEVIARMREPITAADPGVRTWRRGKLANGALVHTARAGSTRYEVRSELVSVRVQIGKGRTKPSARVRREISRVNQALFAAKAEGVSRAVYGLADRVAADASGRTRLARRISGRTVSVSRTPGDGTLLYAVYAR